MMKGLLISAALVLSSLTGAQEILIPDWDHAVAFDLLVSQDPVRPGDEIQIAVMMEIKPGYHLYGPEEKRPSRTEVHLEGELMSSGEPYFPPVVKRDLTGLGEFDLFEGSVVIRIPATVPEGVEVGSDIDARVHVKYQICTDHACSPPDATTLPLSLPVQEPGFPVKRLFPEVFDSAKNK